MHSHTDRPHALYRFYTDDGTLLYVGITLDPGARWRAHRDEKPWWQQVTQITIEIHPDRDTVLEAERRTITAERPKYNIVHNTQRAPTDVTADVTTELDDILITLAGSDPTSGPWGTRAEHMPDMCDARRCPGFYLPYRWTRGHAHYQCAHGHTWTCSWGHDHSGDAPGNLGRGAQ